MTTAKPTRLSKSKIASFEHCPKRLWLQVHRRHEAKFDAATLARFQFGHDVGRRARFMLPDGILIDTGLDMAAAISQTNALIAKRGVAPIFEGTFQHENVLVRVDVLQPYGEGWELIEVKASSRVGGYHLADVATQLWTVRGNGLDVTKVTIRHMATRINWGRPNIAGIRFKDTDVTSDVEQFVANRPRLAAAASETLAGPEPRRDMGIFCYRPLACEFRDYCRSCTLHDLNVPVSTPSDLDDTRSLYMKDAKRGSLR